MEKFIEDVSNELHLEYDTVDKYLKYGFSTTASCDEICSAIQKIYERFILDEGVSVEIREHAKQVQESVGQVYFDSIYTLENVITLIESNKPFFATDYRKFLTASLFMLGGWPEKGKTPTEEDIEWLRESFRKFPPKGIKLHN